MDLKEEVELVVEEEEEELEVGRGPLLEGSHTEIYEVKSQHP